jgi:hypothetical protein
MMITNFVGQEALPASLRVLAWAFIPTYFWYVGKSFQFDNRYEWSRKTFWRRFWGVLFGIARVGYERPKLKDLPWMAITIAIILIMLMNASALNGIAIAFDQPIPSNRDLLIQVIQTPIIFIASYAIGYLWGYFFNPEMDLEIRDPHLEKD